MTKYFNETCADRTLRMAKNTFARIHNEAQQELAKDMLWELVILTEELRFIFRQLDIRLKAKGIDLLKDNE